MYGCTVCKHVCRPIWWWGYLVRVIWKVRYPAMNDARRVSDCLPEPPTPTSSAWPRGIRMIREIVIKWVMASSKKTRSRPAPRTLSLYWASNCCSLSRSRSKLSICQRYNVIVKFQRRWQSECLMLCYLMLYILWKHTHSYFVFDRIIAHADYVGRRGYDVRDRLFVCLSVYCLYVRSIIQKRMIPKCSNLV